MTTRYGLDLPLDKIEVGPNVRRALGSVRELAASIETLGLLNPVTVTDNGGTFELVAGHRRLEAARLLGWETIPAYVGDVDPDADQAAADRLAAQLVENLQREDLDPIDEADGLAALVELVGSQKAAADLVGRSAAHLSKRLKLRELPEEAQTAVRAGSVTLEDAFELSKLDTKAAVKVAESYAAGNRWADQDLATAKRQAERDAAADKAAKAYGRAHPGVEVFAKAKGGWKTLEGYNGLAVDQDAHEAEPCHRVVVGYPGAWESEPRAIFYCAKPERHDKAAGESELKAPDKGAAERKRQAKAERRREREAQADALRFEEAATIAAGLTDRNTALKVLAGYLVDGFDATQDTLLAAVGVQVPERPECQPWEDRPGWDAYKVELAAVVDGLSIAQLYRAAVLGVLRATTHSPAEWQRAKPTALAIGELIATAPQDKETP